MKQEDLKKLKVGELVKVVKNTSAIRWYNKYIGGVAKIIKKEYDGVWLDLPLQTGQINSLGNKSCSHWEPEEIELADEIQLRLE